MMLPNDTLQTIQATARLADEPKVICVNETQMIFHNGEVREIAIEPDRRNHAILSLQSFMSLAESWGEKASVWISDKKLCVVKDSEDRRDRAVFELRYHPVYSTLRHFHEGQTFNQRDMVRLLFHDLRGCIPDDLVFVFRSIEFNRRNDGSSNVNHGSESLGRGVEAKIQGIKDIPEMFNVQSPVFDHDGMRQRVPIRLTVQPNPHDETFRIQVYPGDLMTAGEASLQILEELLVSSLDCPVFCGYVD